MTENTLHPGFYKIIRFDIISDNGPVSISTLVPEIVITESMDNDCIRGHATILDKAGLLERLPIRGEERMIVEIEDVEQNRHAYDFFLYKVDNVEILGPNDGVTYLIHFCSFSRYVSSLSRVCKSYDEFVHTIAKDIFDQYFKPQSKNLQEILPNYTKLNDPSATDSVQHIVIPNMTPNQTMDFLVRRSYSSLRNSSSFRFFENTKGYHFATDEDLFKNAGEPMTFTFSDAIPKDGASFLEQRRNLIDFQNSKRINTIADISSGGYRNDIIEIDIVKREIATKSYNYLQERFSLNQNGFEKEDHHTYGFSERTFNDENARKFMVIKTNVADDPGSLSPNNNFSEMVSSKVAYRYHLDKLSVTAESHGFLNVTCGDVVRLNIINNTAVKEKLEEDTKISGLYLVRRITRQFIRENYRNTMILSKVEWTESDGYINPNLLLTGL